MKYRIKIITYGSGRKTYTPQFKTRFKWAGIDYEGRVDWYSYQCDNREDALRRIDKHLSGNAKAQTIEFEYINKP